MAVMPAFRNLTQSQWVPRPSETVLRGQSLKGLISERSLAFAYRNVPIFRSLSVEELGECYCGFLNKSLLFLFLFLSLREGFTNVQINILKLKASDISI